MPISFDRRLLIYTTILFVAVRLINLVDSFIDPALDSTRLNYTLFVLLDLLLRFMILLPV